MIFDPFGDFETRGYWIASQPLTPAKWRPYAEGLKALLLQEGVKCDAGLTTDDVRILRVPGTMNHKYDPPRPVVLLHLGKMYDFGTHLLFLTGHRMTSAAAQPAQRDVMEPADWSAPDPAFAELNPSDALAAGVTPAGAFLIDPTPVFEQCGFLRDARDTGGKDFDNPLWNISVLCTAFMEDGNALAHEISRHHPTYVATDTQALFDRKMADRADRGVGYPSCATIAGLGSKSCALCPLFSKGKSPLNIRRVFTATVTADVLHPNAELKRMFHDEPLSDVLVAMNKIFAVVKYGDQILIANIIAKHVEFFGEPEFHKMMANLTIPTTNGGTTTLTSMR